LATPLSKNDRTYISALWPTGVATDRREELRSRMAERWLRGHDAAGGYKARPVWTYFELAEAHQWLYLGEQQKLWQVLHWFWDHQDSPGLYTWGEGEGEENSFG
jgi:hypothetical protein